MSVASIENQLQELERGLLLTTCPDKAQRLCAEIHRLKALEYCRRQRAANYQSRHRAFQRSLILTGGHGCTEAQAIQ